jgi:hypothetical protein
MKMIISPNFDIIPMQLILNHGGTVGSSIDAQPCSSRIKKVTLNNSFPIRLRYQ